MAGLALLIGCAPGSALLTGKSSTGGNSLSCTDCHSGETTSTYGLDVLSAKAQYYGGSGHYNGPRIFEPAGSAELYISDGSNSMYCNGGDPGGCSKCHTDQGFVALVGNWSGTQVNVPAASQPGCFTCHAPHETGDFTLRTQAPVALVDGVTTYDMGKGNLCVKCHQARTKASSGVTATNTSFVIGFGALIAGSPYPAPADPTKAPPNLQRWSSSSGSHHGPQADFIEGVDNWKYTGKTDYVASPHLSATDSCVTCHMYGPTTGRLGGNLSIGGHGTYLNGAVHGSPVDFVAQCQTCHKTGGTGAVWPTVVTATTFQSSGHTSGDIDGDLSTDDILVEIDHLKKKLLTYFGNSANFLDITYNVTLDSNLKISAYGAFSISASSNGHAPVTTLPTPISPRSDYTPGGVPGDTQGWHKDWEFNGFTPLVGVTSVLAYPALNKWQSQSLWNFKYFMEDKSEGIHNPTFAARILFDALKNLQDNGVGGITLGTRP